MAILRKSFWTHVAHYRSVIVPAPAYRDWKSRGRFRASSILRILNVLRGEYSTHKFRQMSTKRRTPAYLAWPNFANARTKEDALGCPLFPYREGRLRRGRRFARCANSQSGGVIWTDEALKAETRENKSAIV